MDSIELDGRIKAGYSILKGKSPETKVPVNDFIMTNTEAQARVITDAINKYQTVKPLTAVKPITKSCFNGTPLTLTEVPSQEGPSTQSNVHNNSTAAARPSHERPHLTQGSITRRHEKQHHRAR